MYVLKKGASVASKLVIIYRVSVLLFYHQHCLGGRAPISLQKCCSCRSSALPGVVVPAWLRSVKGSESGKPRHRYISYESSSFFLLNSQCSVSILSYLSWRRSQNGGLLSAVGGESNCQKSAGWVSHPLKKFPPLKTSPPLKSHPLKKFPPLKTSPPLKSHLWKKLPHLKTSSPLKKFPPL